MFVLACGMVSPFLNTLTSKFFVHQICESIKTVWEDPLKAKQDKIRRCKIDFNVLFFEFFNGKITKLDSVLLKIRGS